MEPMTPKANNPQMQLLKKISRRWSQWQYQYADKYLASTTPEKLISVGEKKMLKTFHQAARSIPAYQHLLSDQGIKADHIKTIADFRKLVPIVDKKKLFHTYDLKSFCKNGTFEEIRSFFSSSGSSGLFSFGVESWKAARTASFSIEYLLDHYFSIFEKKTLLINCLPMGVRVPTRHLQTAEASVRSDVILAMIRQLNKEFEQFILIGESPFLKKVVDEGAENGIDWQDICVHLITGGEFIAENYRTYMGKLLGIDFEKPENGIIAVNMGLSELSLSLFRESIETIQLRRNVFENETLRSIFAVNAECHCPLIMQYFPPQVFLETQPDINGRPQLVVSLLDKNIQLPLLRYNTEDTGRCLSYQEMDKLLKDHKLSHLLPHSKLPFVLVSGKYQPILMPDGRAISPSIVKEAIYQHFATANSLTGNFFIQKKFAKEPPSVIVQLRKGHSASQENEHNLDEALIGYCGCELECLQIPYQEFPYGMELSYEKKFTYA